MTRNNHKGYSVIIKAASDGNLQKETPWQWLQSCPSMVGVEPLTRDIVFGKEAATGQAGSLKFKYHYN